MTLTIGGVAVDPWLSRGSLSFENTLSSEPDTLSFSLVAVGAAGPCPVLTGGVDVTYTDSTGALVFGGVLGTPADVPLGLHAGYSVTCSDWRARADQRTLNARRRNMTAGQMIVYLFKRYAPQFDTSLVNLGGAVLGSVRFKPPERLTQALDRLSALTGYVWDITPDKKVVWAPAGSTAAPYSLTDTSLNFEDLTLTEDRSELKNRVIVMGSRSPIDPPITESFAGDGVQRHWPLSYRPYVQDDYLELDESFGSFDVAPGGRWVQADVTNPTPPAGHAPTDGYLFTTTMSGGALSESGWLQIVGGSGTWGQVALMSAAVYARGDGFKRFELDVYAENTTGQGRFGLWDPTNTGALAGEEFGLFFDAGTLKASQGGTTSGTTLAYTGGALTSYTRIRITPKAVSGAVIQAQTGANYGTRTWTTLLDTNTGSLAGYTFAAAFSRTFVGRADRARVSNRLYDITVTVGGASKTVGVLNADESSGVDCVIGGGLSDSENPSLSFFSDVIPPAGSPAGSRNVVITYHRAQQVTAAAQDVASIAACAALEGTDGVHETWVDAPECDTVDLARKRAAQEVQLYGQAARTIAWTTTARGLRAGQVIQAAVTVRQRPVVGEFLITRVSGQSLGAPGWMRYSVEASSRMTGAGDLLLELLGLGRKLDTQALDDGSTIQEFAFAADTVAWSDASTLAAGPLPPYRLEPPATTLDSTADWTAGTHTRTAAVAGTLTIASATFTRASTATMPDTGATVASGAPRFPAVAGTVGLLIEEGTTNTVANPSFETWSGGLPTSWTKGSTATVAQVTGWRGTGSAVQFSTTVSGNAGTNRLTVGSAITAGATHSISFRARRVSGVGSLDIAVDLWAGPLTTFNPPDGAWRLHTFTGTATANASGALNFYTGTTGGVWEIDEVQVEVKSAFTSFIAGTRSPEAAGFSVADVLRAERGALVLEVYLSGEILKNGGTSRSWYLFRAGVGTSGGVNEFAIQRLSNGNLTTVTRNSSGTATDTYWNPGTLSPGLYRIGVRWKPGEVKVWWQGAVPAFLLTSPAGTPNQPTAIQPTAWVGSQSATTGQANAMTTQLAAWLDDPTDAQMAAYTAAGGSLGDATYRHDFRNATLTPETVATHLTAWLDSGAGGEADNGQAWNTPTPTQATPANTTIGRRYRCQNDLAGSGLTAWGPAVGERGRRGRYIQVETTLTTPPGATAAPSVDAITLTPTAARVGLCTVGP